MRNRVEQESQNSNQILDVIFNNTHLMVAYLDTQFNFIKVSQAYAQADDRESSFFPGKNYFTLYPNEDNKKIFYQVVESGESHFDCAKPFEYAEYSDRGITHWDWSLVPVKDSKRIVKSLILTVLNVTDRIWAQEALKESARLNILLLDTIPHPAMLINFKKIVITANKIAIDAGVEVGKHCWATFGKNEYTSQEHQLCLKNDPDFPKEGISCTFCLAEKLIETNKVQNDPIVSAFDKIWDTYWIPVENDLFLHYAIDVTEQRQLDQKKDELNELLKNQVKTRTSELEDLNTALKVLLKKREDDKYELESKVSVNYETLILPFFKRLKISLNNKEHKNLINILETNIDELLKPFLGTRLDPLASLSPAEMQVANMVRQGLSNKEIAQTLNKSIRTITNHRDHIRKKLGLINKKINLQTYLTSF